MNADFPANLTPEQSRLLELFTARAGHFRLESGHHGNLWLDLERLYLKPRKVRPLARALAEV